MHNYALVGIFEGMSQVFSGPDISTRTPYEDDEPTHDSCCLCGKEECMYEDSVGDRYCLDCGLDITRRYTIQLDEI